MRAVVACVVRVDHPLTRVLRQPECKKTMDALKACEERIKAKNNPDLHCTEWLIDHVKCVRRRRAAPATRPCGKQLSISVC